MLPPRLGYLLGSPRGFEDWRGVGFRVEGFRV